MRHQLARPIFVVGSPRSGTTVVGRYLASSKSVLDLGEYRGFFLAYKVVPEFFERVPAPFQAQYIRKLADFTRRVAEEQAHVRRSSWYCDHTPLNLLVAREIARDVPRALFILMVRHHAGVIQSLARSYRDGFEWAGDTLRKRAEIYRQFYSNVTALPTLRTIAVSYDGLCSAPTETLNILERRLASFGFPMEGLSRRAFVESHATSTRDRRATIGVVTRDAVHLRAIASFDAARWTRRHQRMTEEIIAPAQMLILRLFPGALESSPPVHSPV